MFGRMVTLYKGEFRNINKYTAMNKVPSLGVEIEPNINTIRNDKGSEYTL